MQVGDSARLRGYRWLVGWLCDRREEYDDRSGGLTQPSLPGWIFKRQGIIE